MCKGLSLVCFYLLLIVPVNGQEPDSLLALYNNYHQPDTVRLKAIHELAWQTVFTDPARARVYAGKELRLAREKGNTYYQSQAYNTLGCAYHMMGKYHIAIRHHTRALDLRVANKDQKGVAASLSNIGSEYLSLADYPKAFDYYQRSLAIEEKLKNLEGIAQTYTNIGLVYEHMAEGSGKKSDDDRALDYYFKSLGITERTGNKHVSAATLGNIGNIYQRHGELRKAFEYQKKSLHYYQQSDDAQGTASSYGNMGNILLDMSDSDLWSIHIDPAHRYDTTLACYRLCYQAMKTLGELNGMALSLSNIGWIYIHRHQPREAIPFLKEAIDLSKEIGDIDGEKESQELLYYAYKLLNRHDLALEHYEHYITLRDSIFKEENMKEITRKELAFEYARKATADSLKTAQERELVHVHLKQEQTRRNYLYAGLGLVAVFALFMLNRFRVTKKQKGIIEAQKLLVEEQSAKVLHQKELLEEKNKEVLDSIQYAKRLQEVILPPLSLWQRHLPESFIYYKPKDIVAGDFYWMETISAEGEKLVMFAAADSTGHGVPGALVSVVCSNALNRAVKEFHLNTPGEILEKVRQLVIETFRSGNMETEVKDGMDISLCCLKTQGEKKAPLELLWAGANNPLWIHRKGSAEITEVYADKQPIGYHHVQRPFTTHRVPVTPGDRIFLFTDGYADQFGGNKGKKFKYSNLKQLLLSMGNRPLPVFSEKLDHTLNAWKGDLEQLDDICVIGVEL